MANQDRRRGILTASSRMSRIRARTGSRPCEVSTTKCARLRFSASGSCRARMASSFSAVMLSRARIRSRWISGVVVTTTTASTRCLAAGLEQQRHIDHRNGRAGEFGILQEFLPGGAAASDERSARAVSSRRDHAPRAPKACCDRPCRPQSCLEMPPRWQAPPRLRIIGGRSHRHRKPARRLPRTALPWSIFPFRSSRSVQGRSSPASHALRPRAAARCAKTPAMAAAADREW